MHHAVFKVAAFGLCAVALPGCLAAGAPTAETRTIRYAYCTGPGGNVERDPAAANARGTPLTCFNFITR